MEKPTEATAGWPSRRAQRTAASRSQTSRSPTVERPPERPCPRKEKVTTPPTPSTRAKISAARRTAGRSRAPVKPCATTIASPPGVAPGRYAASIGTRSSAVSTARNPPEMIDGTHDRATADSLTDSMWAILLGQEDPGSVAPGSFRAFRATGAHTSADAHVLAGTEEGRNGQAEHA